MNARELLQTIEARGGVATVKRAGGTAKIQIAPRGLVSDLASEIQRFKPRLLELLDEQKPFVDEATPEPEALPFALDATRYGDSISRTVSNRRFLALQILACIETHPNGGQWLRPGRWLSNLWCASNSIEGRTFDSRALVAWARATLEQTAEAQSEVNR